MSGYELARRLTREPRHAGLADHRPGGARGADRPASGGAKAACAAPSANSTAPRCVKCWADVLEVRHLNKHDLEMTRHWSGRGMITEFDSSAARRQLQAPSAKTDETQCFIVFVGGEAFGLPVDSVQTIFGIEAVTPVPLGPREIIGLVNLRGKIVTAVSLRRRLQYAGRAAGRKSTLAVGMEHRGENFALVVDDVGDVIYLNRRNADSRCRRISINTGRSSPKRHIAWKRNSFAARRGTHLRFPAASLTQWDHDRVRQMRGTAT